MALSPFLVSVLVLGSKRGVWAPGPPDPCVLGRPLCLGLRGFCAKAGQPQANRGELVSLAEHQLSIPSADLPAPCILAGVSSTVLTAHVEGRGPGLGSERQMDRPHPHYPLTGAPLGESLR